MWFQGNLVVDRRRDALARSDRGFVISTSTGRTATSKPGHARITQYIEKPKNLADLRDGCRFWQGIDLICLKDD